MKYLVLAIVSAIATSNVFASDASKDAKNKTGRTPASVRPWYYQCQFTPDFQEDLGRFSWQWVPSKNGIAKDKWADVNLAEKIVGTCAKTGGRNDTRCLTAVINGQPAECNSQMIGKFVAAE